LWPQRKLPVIRPLRNDFFHRIYEAELQGASAEELKELLGRARAKKGMFEGDLKEGELEIGQVSALIKNIKPASLVVKEMMEEYKEAVKDTILRNT
jgi:enoyl-[acyl-carrier protein] reductase II